MQIQFRMKNILFMIFGSLLTIVFVWMNIIVWGGELFDKNCIKGKLNYQQAKIVNRLGKLKMPAQKGDRIIASKCSETLRAAHFRDIEVWIPYRKWIQAHLFGDKLNDIK